MWWLWHVARDLAFIENEGLSQLVLTLLYFCPPAQHLSPSLAMASAGLQILGIILTLFGWVNALVSCTLPLWKVTAFIGNSIVVAQVVWEGLWMSCVVQSTGQMQCKVYDSLLALPQDLQAARALCVIALLLALLGVLVAITGAQCTTCVEDEGAKARIVLTAGVLLLLAGILVLIPLFVAKESPFARFHCNQGIVLALAEVVLSLAAKIFGRLPLIGWIIKLVAGLGGIALLVFAIMGIINAINGRAKELPLVGGIRILQ